MAGIKHTLPTSTQRATKEIIQIFFGEGRLLMWVTALKPASGSLAAEQLQCGHVSAERLCLCWAAHQRRRLLSRLSIEATHPGRLADVLQAFPEIRATNKHE